MNFRHHRQDLEDRVALRKLGYIQELNRSIDVFSSFSIAFSVISILTGLITLYGFGLEYGGTASVWTWPLVGTMQLIVVLSLAETASKYPVAGGVYKWTTILSNRRMGWFCGMISLLGWLGCCAGIEYGLGQFTADFFGISQKNATMILAITAVIVAIHCALNLFGIKLVKWFSDLSAVVHIIGVSIIFMLLLAFGGKTGSSEPLKLFQVGHLALLPMAQALLMSAWTLTGFDAAANVSEESLNPSRTVPMGMILSVFVSVLLGTLLLFGLAYATGDVSKVLESGQPAALYVMKCVLGPIVSKYVTAIMLLAQFACGLAVNTLLIRIIFSMARDNGLPGSEYLKYVSRRYGTPVYAIAVAGATTLCLCVGAVGISYLVGLMTGNGRLMLKVLPMITAFSTLGIYLSHSITLGSALKVKTEGLDRDYGQEAPGFSLGIFSKPVRRVSLFWTLLVCCIVMIFNGAAALSFVVVVILVTLYYQQVVRYNMVENTVPLTEEDLLRIERMRTD